MRLVAWISVGAVLFWIAPALAQGTSGTFLLNGIDSARGAYTGTLDIGFLDGAAMVEWLIQDEPSRPGYGLQLGNVVGAVAIETGRGQGVALYRIEAGRLEGILNPVDTHLNAASHEVLSGSGDVAGRYLLSGTNRDGSTYSGIVDIRPTGQTFEVDWTLTGLRFVGRGVRIGDTLVVAYAGDYRPQVWAYCTNAPGLAGLTAEGSATVVVPEVIIPLEADFPGPDWVAARLQALAVDPKIDCPLP